MKPSEQLMTAILASKPADQLMVKWLTQELGRLHQFGLSRRNLIQAQLAEDVRHGEAHHAILKELADLQAKCPHYESTRHIDPAGDGSWTECDLCGKEL